MDDTIFLQGLEARAIIGLADWERTTRQTIQIDLEMACDADAAAREDDVDKTVNYRSVAKAVLAHAESSRYRLVETLAVRIADLIREDFRVPWVRVRVRKPGAIRFSQDVGIVIERGRRDP